MDKFNTDSYKYSQTGYSDDLEWGTVTVDEYYARINSDTDTSDYLLKWGNVKKTVTTPVQKKVPKSRNPILKFLGACLDIRGMFDLYDLLWATKISKTSPSRNLAQHNTKGAAVDMNAQYHNKDVVIYRYVIEKLPRELANIFRVNLRSQLMGDTRLNFTTHMQKYNLPWDEPHLRNQLSIWTAVSKERDQTEDTLMSYRENYKQDANRMWLGASVLYLNNAEMGINPRFTFKTKFFMTIIGIRGENFDNSVINIENYCRKAGIGLHRVIYNLKDFIAYSSPFSQQANTKLDATIPKFILTDEILGQFPTFAQGIVGDRGIYCGDDIYSGFPVVKVFKRKVTDAENIVFIAETGGGKSALVKLIAQQLSCTNVYGLIFDMDGREYSGLAKLVAAHGNVVIVNIGGIAGALGSYFDPVRIITHIDGKFIDEDSYSMSFDFTRSIYKVLAAEACEANYWVSIVISDAISQTYKTAGIKANDPTTWHKSDTLELADVYVTMKTILPSFNSDSQYQNTRTLLVALYSEYFEPDGASVAMFSNKADLESVIKADLLICSFNLEGRAINTIDPVQLNLMQLSAARMAQIRTVFARLQKRKNYKIWEELQYWGEFPDADKTLGAALTMGRKSGDMNLLITNQPSKLLESGGMGVFQNKTSVFIGAIDDASIREELVTRLSIPNMLTELDTIAKESKRARDSKRNTAYRYAFLTVLDGKATTVKVNIPDYLMESEIFKTGIALDEDNYIEDEEKFVSDYVTDLVLEDD